METTTSVFVDGDRGAFLQMADVSDAQCDEWEDDNDIRIFKVTDVVPNELEVKWKN